MRSNIRFEFSNSMCMKLRSFDWLYNVNNSITKTVKVRHRLHVILFCLKPLMIKRDTDGNRSKWLLLYLQVRLYSSQHQPLRSTKQSPHCRLRNRRPPWCIFIYNMVPLVAWSKVSCHNSTSASFEFGLFWYCHGN